jgi:L-alanine-DL-glutamate epimerase-like enolase superfamily enzyme
MVRKLMAFVGAIICFLMIPVSPAPVQAQQAPAPTYVSDKETLKGIRAVEVDVEDHLSEDAVNSGLTREQLQTDVEVKLRIAGIPIYDPSDATAEAASEWRSNGAPALRVTVGTVAYDPVRGLDVFVLDMDVIACVWLYGNPLHFTWAPIWSAPIDYGVSDAEKPDAIRQIVKDRVDIFINDYLTVNPKD